MATSGSVKGFGVRRETSKPGPVKSCRAISLDKAVLSATGLENDRRWMIVDPDGNFITQRECPDLARIVPQLTPDGFSLSMEGNGDVFLQFGRRGDPLAVQIFGERVSAFSVDPSVDSWLGGALGRDVRLVEFDTAAVRQGGVQYPTRDPAPTLFTDNYAILAISEASLADLKGKCGQDLPMDRFRPNIVLSGLEPFQEDYIEFLRSDTLSLRFINPCTRCQMPSIDQTTARPSFDPLPVLSAYRYDDTLKGTKFGSYAAVESGAGSVLQTGASMTVDWSF